MPEIRNILFPFDFSEQGVLAAEFVRAVAARFHARVSVLSVIAQGWNAPPGQRLPLTGLDAPEHELQARMDQALRTVFAGIEACRFTELGDPAWKILEFARKKSVDLIMMPTHGLSGYRAMLLGSVTAKVLEEAHCAVWAATHEEEQRSRPEVRNILCAVDDTPKTLELMLWASEFSGTMGAKLEFLHVVPEVGGSSDRDFQEDVRKEIEQKLAGEEHDAWVEAPLIVISDGVTETIRDQAIRVEADLVVLGRGKLGGPVGRLNSLAYRILRESPCPVMTV